MDSKETKLRSVHEVRALSRLMELSDPENPPSRWRRNEAIKELVTHLVDAAAAEMERKQGRA